MLPKGPWWPGLLRGCLGGLRALKKENYRVTYGFTDLRGKPAGRGRDGRGSTESSRRRRVAGGRGDAHLKRRTSSQRFPTPLLLSLGHTGSI